jgi:hypothetical protein
MSRQATGFNGDPHNGGSLGDLGFSDHSWNRNRPRGIAAEMKFTGADHWSASMGKQILFGRGTFRRRCVQIPGMALVISVMPAGNHCD